MTLIRRLFLTLALAPALLGSALGASAVVAADLPEVTAADRVMGRADAPVTVVEYASFTCSHCADWQTEVLPTFKARFIDTGRVRLVFRNLPTRPAEISMTAAGIAHCAAPDHFFAVAESFFKGQPALFAGGSTWFQDAIAVSGRSRPEIEACFRDPATNAALQAEVAGATAAGVEGTPTFFVNGRKTADHTLETLTAAIEAAAPSTASGR